MPSSYSRKDTAHLNFPTLGRFPRQWRLLDLVSAAFFGFVLLFFLLVSTADPRQRHRLVVVLELGAQSATIEACSAESADHMPCKDPRRNSQLNREMNFSRERHCPLPDETPLCLIPPPDGYKIPVQWPESLHKIWHSNMPHNKIADRKGHQGWMKREDVPRWCSTVY